MNDEIRSKGVIGESLRLPGRRSACPTEFFLRSGFTYFLVSFSFLLASCEREQRPLVLQPPSAQEASLQQLSDLAPGPQHNKARSLANPDENNSWMMAEGKRFYEAYNCVGCHAHGGGGIGPPLMDEKWIYGHEPQQVYASVVKGRPNGMPSFRGKISTINSGKSWRTFAV